MNAVVESTIPIEASVKEGAAATAIILSIDNAVGAKALNPLELAREAFKFNEFGKLAIVQAEKAAFSSPETFGLGGDLMKAINQNIKAAGEARKSRTDKINSVVDYITKLFAPGIEKLTKAKITLQGKLNAYAQLEEDKRKIAAAEEQKRVEAAALALAEAQQAMGDNAGADQVMDDAAKLSEKIVENTKVVGRGAFGSTSHQQGRWVGRVVNPSAFLKAMIEQNPDKILEYVEFKVSALNKLAAALGKTPTGLTVAGFEYTQDKNTRVK